MNRKKLLDYLVKTMNGMAYGLFSTLIVGTIVGTIASFLPAGKVTTLIISLGSLLKQLLGFGIGVGIAWSLKLDGLKLISAAVSGVIASYFTQEVGFKIGDPLVIYVVVILTVELCNLILVKKTSVDIILIPLMFITLATLFTLVFSKPITYVTTAVGLFINKATNLQPLLMGILISVLMGMALTAPISSAAIAIAISLGGDTGSLAGGAAVVGCSVQMIGFAIMSRKDNSLGTILSIGIGTSMLQFKNIMKKPIIWLPTIIVSAILGPIAIMTFDLKASKIGAGMGTSGLVGPIDVLSLGGWTLDTWTNVILLLFVLPAVLVLMVDVVFRKYGLIVDGDLKI